MFFNWLTTMANEASCSRAATNGVWGSRQGGRRCSQQCSAMQFVIPGLSSNRNCNAAASKHKLPTRWTRGSTCEMRCQSSTQAHRAQAAHDIKDGLWRHRRHADRPLLPLPTTAASLPPAPPLPYQPPACVQFQFVRRAACLASTLLCWPASCGGGTGGGGTAASPPSVRRWALPTTAHAFAVCK